MERRTFLGGLTAASFGVSAGESLSPNRSLTERKTLGQAGSPRFFRDLLKSKFQETRFSCAAMEKDRRF